MTYERPEALEVGAATEVILGSKEDDALIDSQFQRPTLVAVDEIE